MRSRAAILPHPADPFMFAYWLDFYNRIWKSEVDRLYICINSPMEKEVVDYMISLEQGKPHIFIAYADRMLDHGNSIKLLLEECKEEYVMLVEDDGYIFKPGQVDACFQRVESGECEVLGSPRGSCSQLIWDRAAEKFGLDYSGVGDQGPNFWPCFLFTKRQHLLDTDRNFNARAWQPNELIEPLGIHNIGELAVGDTFVNTSLQLRAKGLRVARVPQYHGSTDDIADYEKQANLFDGVCPWVHVGSLSSGTHGVLQDDRGRALARRLVDEPKQEHTILPNYVNSEQERSEWERRVAFWEMFYDFGDGVKQALPEFSNLYREAINRIVFQFGLNTGNIRKRKILYHSLGL